MKRRLKWIECEPMINKESKVYRSDYKDFKFRIIETVKEVNVLIGDFNKGVTYDPGDDNINFNSLKDAMNYCEQYSS